MNNDLYLTILEDEGNLSSTPFLCDYPSNSFLVYDVDFSFDYDHNDGSFNMVTFYTFQERDPEDESRPVILSCVDCVKIFSDSDCVNFIVRPQIFSRLKTELSRFIR